MLNDVHAKVLVTGRNRSGSWHIRGEQLGAAIGAKVELNASNVHGYDFAVLVKRPRPELLRPMHSAGVPVVWDVVDAWPQPEGNDWGRERCLAWLREEFKEVAPVGIIAATARMAEDCAEFGVPVLVLPHHARPKQAVNPLREQVQVIGYEGGERYLGHWTAALDRECQKRGWHFVVNPAALANLDIVVAFRSAKGYAARHWKSNVKLANAQGSGTPCVLNREKGYLETACGGEVWADNDEELRAAFDQLTPHAARVRMAERLRAAQPKLDDIAERYRQWLDQLKS